MFQITIKGETIEELMGHINSIGSIAREPAPKTTKTSKLVSKAQVEALEPEPVEAAISADDAALQRELNEVVEPMPDTARAVVDAGTGQPISPVQQAVQMTKADVKAAAVKLAGKDTPALAALLKKYDAANLSGVSDEALPAFAADVMAALG